MAAVAVAVCVVVGFLCRVSVYRLAGTSWIDVIGGLGAFWAPFWRTLLLLAARTPNRLCRLWKTINWETPPKKLKK